MIAIGADHGGFELKEEIRKFLEKEGLDNKDFGAYSTDRVDYPNIAKKICKEVQEGKCEKGILICRSGYGMAMVANKFKGIRSAPCFCTRAAQFSRMHNNSNVLSLGADYITTEEAFKIVKVWLETDFEGGRHQERLDLVTEIENENMK
ncbi:MAG: ribose 5-phosphate isomerase B [Clostridiales bacterium]|nr:ribose 5-phosphate isomerase B [Clostridiales bacterium]